MVKHENSYYLFYSANDWSGGNYAVGYAVCASVLGPCTKPTTRPVYSSGGGVAGPGGQEFVLDAAGQLLVVYHGWTSGAVGYPKGARALRLDPVSFGSGAPALSGPDSGTVVVQP